MGTFVGGVIEGVGNGALCNPLNKRGFMVHVS
jgi:hypothetical protein